MSREFDNILDDCLERVLINGETVEQCLQSFPQHAEELKPLLETALTASQVSAIQPRPEFRERARYQLQAAFRDMEEKRRRSFFSWGWQPRWATTAITIALVLLLSGGGTVAAARGSMPDETLYPVKLATEQTRLVLSFSELGKAEYYVKLADERVNEIVYLAGENKPEQIEQTADRLNKHLVAMANLSAPEGEVYEAAATLEVEEELELVTEEDAGQEETLPPEITIGAEGEEAVEEEAPAKKESSKQAKQLSPEKITAVREAPGAAEQFGTGAGANITADRRTNLKITVTNQASTNTARLRALLETAPESAKPALEKAIYNLEANYKKAIESLDKP